MGITNPFLGEIPQPQKDSEVVYNPQIPNPNYSAQVNTPLIHNLFCETLETLNDATDLSYTTKEIVLTQVIIQGYHDVGADATATLDVYINDVLILSVNVATLIDTVTPFNYNIPLEHVLIGVNSRFRLTTSRTGGTIVGNASFIGYEYTKQ